LELTGWLRPEPIPATCRINLRLLLEITDCFMQREKTMSWEPFKRSLSEFDKIISNLGVAIGAEAPPSLQLCTMREFLADREILSESDLLSKWNSRDFKDFNDAAIVVRRLTDSVVALSDQPEGVLRKRLKQVLSGSLVQDFSPEQAKDHFYELEIATVFKKAGFNVELREPDVVVSGNGLSGDLGMACKYPSSEAQIQAHLSKGYRQLANQKMDGCVVIGLDTIVFRAAFESPPRFLDFRQGDRHPLDVANTLVNEAMQALVVKRAEGYPSEAPVDGAILTLSMHGFWDDPVGITSVTSWAVQSDIGNHRSSDIRRLVEAVR
jgi:hypothetical protein